MTKIHVVGVGLDGSVGVSEKVRQLIKQAKLLVGSSRHLDYFSQSQTDIPTERLLLGDLSQTITKIRQHLKQGTNPIVILVSGDPLFFGLGRLLLAELPPEELTFHPHLSSIQLAFNRLKIPWQDAKIVSIHGRSVDELISVLQQGVEKIAVLTDATNNPRAIASLLESLSLPSQYKIWVCENLGGDRERILEIPNSQKLDLRFLQEEKFSLLNVVVLLRHNKNKELNLNNLPKLGIPDDCFACFSDRPGLITKREVRVLILGELALHPRQVVWDIGAGTGSVSIEVARLFPSSQVYAIEKTAAGISLIHKNCDRFQVENITAVAGKAPNILLDLPKCDRVFVGGSGGSLGEILNVCAQNLNPDGVVVLALATLEHLNTALSWFKSHNWEFKLLQVQLSRSVPVRELTRFAPLNPVTIVTAKFPKILTTEH
ncbi:bifunctional cobalt-precorrin-7 (C(5))-methyltransferase/cobalt-precorrin-6B (C(15))-methyltransferase [Mastigocoleus testarum]|uniref:tRNA (guanine(46)-N(7))-methyltransferase n=1 Tax=Mastigocoleus testarum BC008 TaxID=371196 RepID=A0A0V7ZJB2_9CYAN|nr:bifunctional cobalt-precorrin-7 (C(5))-methyltransferase/cobalt-precorrin-6B (C(15))-methyltransferase [Mastigocoleus testarum]KST63988.1 ATP-binding protein [Mastigocoleus testarum BC008]KST64698.1 ATP-binding protein [Mastigocoleus testarum BC008]